MQYPEPAEHRAAPSTGWRRLMPRARAGAVIAAITTLSLVAGLVVLTQVSDRSVREADERLGRHSDELRHEIEDLVAAATRDIRLARQNASYARALGNTTGQLLPEDRVLVEAAISYVGDRYQTDEICLIRNDAVETARYTGGGYIAPVDELSPDESGNPAFAGALALADDEVFQTEPYVSPDSLRWVLGFGTPIVAETGPAAGLLHMEIPLVRFDEEIAEVPFGGTSYGIIIDRSGQLLSSPRLAEFRADQGLESDPKTAPFPLAAASGSASWRAAVTQMLSTGSGVLGYEDGGVAYRVSYRSTEGSPRIIATVSPVGELYADVERLKLNLAVTVGPLLLLMILLSGWFTRRLSATNRTLAATNQQLAQTSRASSELAAIVRSGDDAMLSVDRDGTITTWNEGAHQMYGIPHEQAIGTPLTSLFRPDQRHDVPRLMASVLSGEAVQHHECVHLTADDRPLDVSITLSPIRVPDGTVARAALVVRDISDRKRLESELAHQALHDALTGLPNRALFHDRLRHSLDRAQRPLSGSRQAVLFIDLDDFKLINDTLGHRFGDDLLIAVAQRISDTLRPGDTAARLGGDEFTVLLENVEEGSARLVADRLIERIREPYDLDGHQVSVTASIGIALSRSSADIPDDLLRNADTALYEAKGRGKGRHETFQPVMNARVWRRLELESDLRQALTNREFLLHYQPIVELATGRIAEVEALVRWAHPERGLLAPGEFVPLAEGSGLVIELGATVLRTACQQLAAWDVDIPAARGIVMSVNVSSRELNEVGFAETVRATLAEAGLAPERLKLELTETVTLDEEGPTTASLTSLRDMGVHLSIDDFGTGYSSLGYFRRLPIDSLKIDRLLIEGLGREPQNAAIVSAAVAFADALGLQVTGEGIETEEQAEVLRRLDCAYGQGFLFSPARDSQTIAGFLRLGGIIHRPWATPAIATGTDAAALGDRPDPEGFWSEADLDSRNAA